MYRWRECGRKTRLGGCGTLQHACIQHACMACETKLEETSRYSYCFHTNQHVKDASERNILHRRLMEIHQEGEDLGQNAKRKTKPKKWFQNVLNDHDVKC